MLRFLAFVILIAFVSGQQYQPNWESLDARPIPQWYDQAKFGIFIHWGVYSVPSYACDGTPLAEWYWWYLRGANISCFVDWHKQTYGPNFKYEDFAPMFKPELFDVNSWANLFKKAGAKYVVFTTKHHDGFCNWPSAQSWNWNSVDNGPHLDLTEIITTAVRNAGIHVGLYHSLFEWFNPLYLADRATGGKSTVYVNTTLQPQLHDIVNRYKPDLIWSDGDWEMNDSYWGSKEFLAWLYNSSPVKQNVVVNDRWGDGDDCVHGGFWTCDDRFNPGHLIKHKWENALTIDSYSWGYRRNTNITQYLTINELLFQLASTVSCGGNMLLNVGPTYYGFIIPVFEERLLQIGAWLQINGESIYSTIPWRVQNDTVVGNLWYTQTASAIYAIALGYPATTIVVMNAPKPVAGATIAMLGYNGTIQWNYSNNSVNILMPPITDLPSPYAWAFKLANFT